MAGARTNGLGGGIFSINRPARIERCINEAPERHRCDSPANQTIFQRSEDCVTCVTPPYARKVEFRNSGRRPERMILRAGMRRTAWLPPNGCALGLGHLPATRATESYLEQVRVSVWCDSTTPIHPSGAKHVRPRQPIIDSRSFSTTTASPRSAATTTFSVEPVTRVLRSRGSLIVARHPQKSRDAVRRR